MKKITLIFLIILGCISCNENGAGSKNSNVDTLVYTPSPDITVSQTKYIYTSAALLLPKIRITKGRMVPDDNPLSLVKGELIKAPDTAVIYMTKFIAKSDIQEVDNYTENDRYRALDDYDKTLQNTLNNCYEPIVFYENNSSYYAEDLTFGRKAKVLKKMCNVFDSYKDAYVSKEKDTGQYLDVYGMN